MVTNIGEIALACVEEPPVEEADTEAVFNDPYKCTGYISEAAASVRYTCGGLQKRLKKLRELTSA